MGEQRKNGILLPKLFQPTVRKNYSSEREKPLKFEEAELKRFQSMVILRLKYHFSSYKTLPRTKPAL